MTIAGKKSVSKGSAKLLVRIKRSVNGPRLEWRLFFKAEARPTEALAEFNARDELELKFTVDKDEIPKSNKENINTINTYEGRVIKIETFKIEEILDCYANETGDFNNTLIVEVLKKSQREEIVLQFESEQEFRRTLFTYKYFKMRNRLANSSLGEHSDGSSSPSLSTKSKSSVSSAEVAPSPPDYNAKVFDYTKSSNGIASHYIKKFENCANDTGSYQPSSKSLDYMAINGQRLKQCKIQEIKLDQKNRNFGEASILSSRRSKSEFNLSQTAENKGFSLSNEGQKADLGEIDGLIYTDVEYESMEYPSMNFAINKLVSSSVAQVPLKPQRRKQLLRRIKGRAPPPPGGAEDQAGRKETGRGVVIKIGTAGGERIPTKESDGFPLRTNSQVPRAHMGASGYESDREEWRSRSTFSSSAFHSLARPARQALAAYYRLSAPCPAPQPAPRKGAQRAARPPAGPPAGQDYVVVSQLAPQESKGYGRAPFHQEYKRNTLGGSMNYLNISSRLCGLTERLKDKPWQARPEGQLKPVIKKSPAQEGSKRPVVRTCSAEPPKKVTFSAFATVQVV